MNLFRFGFVIICAACSPAVQIETRLIGPEVPAPLRETCEVAAMQAETLGDVARILTDHVEALGCANGKITATDEILTAFEAQLKEGPK